MARLPRFKSVTAQSQRDASITGGGGRGGHGLLRDEISKDSCRGSACRAAETWKMTNVKLIWLSDLNYRFVADAEVSLYTALRTLPQEFPSKNPISRINSIIIIIIIDVISTMAIFPTPSPVGKPKSKALTRNVRWAAINIYKTSHLSMDEFLLGIFYCVGRYECIDFTAYRVFTFLFNIAKCHLSWAFPC